MSASGGTTQGTAAVLATELSDSAQEVVGPGAWAVNNAAAVGAASSVVRAAGGAGVRHVCTALGFGFSATTALAAITTVTVNLRDGASGAGTVLWTWQYTLPAGTLLPTTVTLGGLEILGSAATAMTLEFAAGVGNLLTFVNLSGFDA